MKLSREAIGGIKNYNLKLRAIKYDGKLMGWRAY